MIAPVRVEKIVSLPVINPETNGVSRSFTYHGKVDRIEGGKVIDWKSAQDPSAFILEKKLGFQPYLYALAAEAEGISITAIEYRLVTVPTIRMCSKDEKAAHDVTDDIVEKCPNCDTGEELCGEHFDLADDIPAAYERRCIEWILKNPNNMVTHTLTLNASRMEQARAFLWDCSKRILDNRKRDLWLCNENACHHWQRVCEYAPLCEAVVDGADLDWVIDEGFDVQEKPHPELGDAGKANKDVLTYTSMSVLTLCEMKYFWQFERGLRRRNDYSEPMWLGSAMHAGLEAFTGGNKPIALAAVDAWADANPAIGSDLKHKQQQVAKAKAMVQTAALKWLS